MPTGTGAVNERNLPNSAYEINPALFTQLTQKQVFNPANLVCPAFGGNFVTKTLRQVGIVARIRLWIVGSIVVSGMTSASTLVPTFKWPYGLFKNVQLSGNQQNNFISASGFDLHLRKLIQYRAFKDDWSVAGIAPAGLSGTAGNGTFPFKVAIDVPVAMDMVSLVGSLYAQSEATNLVLQLTTDSLANLFTFTGAGTAVLADTAGDANSSPTVFVEETIFSIPYHPSKPNVLVIPDLTVLHGIIANDNPVASQSSVTTEMYRSNANLERLVFYTDNNNALLTSANYVDAQLLYGAKETPYSWTPIDFLRLQNNVDNRILTSSMPDGTYALDFTAESPARDQVILEGVTNLRIQTDYVAGQPSSAAAKVHWVQETLFA